MDLRGNGMHDLTTNTFFWILVAVAAAATLVYFRGSRRNRAIMKRVSAVLESVFAPEENVYERIGGLIGFNGRYTCPGPFRSVKITCTLKPRHSLFFLPVSALLGVADRLYLTLESREPVIGECHLIERGYYRGRCPTIEGEGEFEKETIDWEGTAYMRLSAGLESKEALERLRRTLRPARLVRHFCTYPGDPPHIYLYLHPGPGREVELESLLNGLLSETQRLLKKDRQRRRGPAGRKGRAKSSRVAPE